MDDDEYLTSGLCPACFCINLDSPDLSYEPRPVADIVAGCRIGCTFCGLLTFSLDLKFRMVDADDFSTTYVSLSGRDEDRDPENSDCIIAELHGYGDDVMATLDITILHGEHENSEDGKASSDSLF